MKGVVFTEFLEMVEDRFGLEIVDELLEGTKLPSGGIYTAIGTYHHDELLELVTRLSKLRSVPVPDLMHTYGVYLFGRFAKIYPQFFDGVGCTFNFLESIEPRIHVEVRKLYDDVELPRFSSQRTTDQRLILTYQSSRRLGDFAAGLIDGCIAHFGEPIDCVREDLATIPETIIRFTMKYREPADGGR